MKVWPAATGYDIDVDGQVSASELVDAIASVTGADIKGQPDDTSVGPNHLRNASLEQALRKLLPKVPFAVRFDADDMPETIIFLSHSDGAGEPDSTDSDDSTEPEDETEPPDDSTLDSGG